MMAKKIDNTYIPKFVPNNLPWYERDGLNTWYEQNKFNDFLKDPDKHFENLQINNFDLIFNKEKLSSQKVKQYQTIDHKKLWVIQNKKESISCHLYLEMLCEKICLFRMRLYMSISRLTRKVWVEDVLLKKMKMITTKKHGRIIFVTCQCVSLIGFLVFLVLIM